MKKTVSIAIMLIAIISLLCGCGAAETARPEPTAEPTPTVESVTVPQQSEASPEPTAEPTPVVESVTVPQQSEASPEPAAENSADPYEAVLELYYTALTEGWSGEKLFNSDVNFLCSYCTEGNPLDNVGYAAMDVDGDGVDELLIGSLTDDDYLRDVIFDMYTVKDGQCVQVFASQERQRYYMSADGGFMTDWANSASDYGLYALSYSGGQLTELGPVDAPQYIRAELAPFSSYR